MPLSNLKSLTPRQAERRQRILATAQALVGELGYDAVTMRMIAQESDTAEKTLYNIFASKDRLIALAAHDRTASIFVTAFARQPQAGWPRLREFARTAADMTLEGPLLSRTLAALLVEHADHAGLAGIYDDHAGPIVRDMMDQGFLEASVPLAELVRTLRLAVVATVMFWSKGQIADAELADFMVRRCAETLLPYATAAGADLLRPAARGL
ncbi:TetR/AcrR family transcriptional regulator [Novosphingobium sp. SL115]|uniref:TetR/AcrR family transcriptional regulator n=1 Tax=Novosphingobium sp. SL115 TaxID=2995150 RepID=UPI002276A2C0|nr:TetR/AcrR family transcriptional regulator [Novosphingobium sp. SL115]MCY1673070.1 TetR/AcrR family transcriptional regulator [Novosphingobium sp. SL115]